MSKVKIGFSGLNVPEQIERARLITGKMTGNGNYTTPSPTLADVTATVNALETAYNESRGHDKTKVAIANLRRKEMLFIISQEAAYVQEASGGNAEKILSSGFDVIAPRQPHSDTAGAVTNVQLSDGSVSGKIRVDFDKASDTVLYVVLTSLDGDFKNTEPKGITTKLHKEIGNFDPGTQVWVKVIALGKEEAGSPSKPVFIIVR